MTRKEIEQEYTVKDGIIQDLGKFEAEMVYAPYFYDASLDGGCEELSFMEDGCGEYLCLIAVTKEDRAEFPELSADTAFVAVSECDQGFVVVTELTEERANEWRAEYAESDCEEESA